MSAQQPPRPPETADVPTLLVKIFGKDRPGITAGLFDTLAAFSVDVIDIEQVVTRGRIVLCALVTRRPGRRGEGELRATVHSWAESLKLQAEIISGTATTSRVAAAVRRSPCSVSR